MEIGPNKVDGGARPRPAPIEQRRATPEETNERSRKDSVQLSAETRVRIAEAADHALGYSDRGMREKVRVHSDSIDSTGRDQGQERLQRIRDRIDSGYYEREDIKRRIAGRLADALMPPPNSNSE